MALTKKELNDRLDELGVDHDPDATNAELEALLDEHEPKAVADVTDEAEPGTGSFQEAEAERVEHDAAALDQEPEELVMPFGGPQPPRSAPQAGDDALIHKGE